MTTRNSPPIEQRLASEIDMARIHSDHYVIVDSGPYYAQLMPNHDAIYGEVVSNHYLHGADRLTRAQESRIEALDWSRPEVPCHPNCSGPHPGFSRVWGPGTSSREIARDMLEALLVAIARAGEGAAPVVVKTGRRVTKPTTGPVPGH